MPERRRNNLRSSALIVAVLFLVVHVTFAYFVITIQQSLLETRSQVVFDDYVTKQSSTAITKLEGYNDLMYSIRALFLSSEGVTEPEWLTYINSLNVFDRYPAIFRVKYLEKKSDAWKIKYISTPDSLPGNSTVEDMVTEPQKLKYYTEAARIGTPYISDRGYDAKTQSYYYRVYLAIYKRNSDVKSAEAREENVVGAIALTFDFSDFINYSFRKNNPWGGDIQLRVSDSIDEPERTLVYENAVNIEGTPRQKTVEFKFGERKFDMEFQGSSAFGILNAESMFIEAFFYILVLIGVGLSIRIYSFLPRLVRN